MSVVNKIFTWHGPSPQNVYSRQNIWINQCIWIHKCSLAWTYTEHCAGVRGRVVQRHRKGRIYPRVAKMVSNKQQTCKRPYLHTNTDTLTSLRLLVCNLLYFSPGLYEMAFLCPHLCEAFSFTTSVSIAVFYQTVLSSLILCLGSEASWRQNLFLMSYAYSRALPRARVQLMFAKLNMIVQK